MNFLFAAIEDATTLEEDDTGTLTYCMDAAFAAHANGMTSQSGSMFALGKGAIINSSSKQKRNARSSAEAELNAVNNKTLTVTWTKRFINHQKLNVKLNVIFQDNASSIKLLEHGKESSGKRTRHFDARLFCVTDLMSSK